MNFKNENGTLTVYLSGRIDSANAESVGEEIGKILTDNAGTFENPVFDADELAYISSAGLRMVLKYRKMYATLRIINASSEVYDIFDMTGFTEMINIEKAYRRLSVEGCEEIGQGANGKVYRLDDETIIKVYRNPDSLPDIKRERELARTAFVLGIPTAIPYDVVRVGDGYGSVFELIRAHSFSKQIASNPDNWQNYMPPFVDLLKRIHSTDVHDVDIPSMKEVAVGWVRFLADYLPKEQYDKLLSLVEAVPEDSHMLHGDYHTKNVMTQGDEILLIDMDTLCTGNPVFEFGSIFLAFDGYSENDPAIIEKFHGFSRDIGVGIWNKTLELYFGTTDPAVLAGYADKAKIIGYTRMMRRTIRRGGLETEAGRRDIETCKQHLAELLARTDSIAY